MMKMAASFPKPYHRIASGTQATPGIGEKIRTKGSEKLLTDGERAIPMPSGTAINTDKLNPIKTRTKLTDTSSHKYPDQAIFPNALKTTKGGGKRSTEYAGDIRPKSPVIEAKCQITKKIVTASVPCQARFRLGVCKCASWLGQETQIKKRVGRGHFFEVAGLLGPFERFERGVGIDVPGVIDAPPGVRYD